MCVCCLVPGDWYRAVVEKRQASKATIFFVDFGNLITANVSNLRPFSRLFCPLPPQAMKCSFTGNLVFFQFMSLDEQYELRLLLYYKIIHSGNLIYLFINCIVRQIFVTMAFKKYILVYYVYMYVFVCVCVCQCLCVRVSMFLCACVNVCVCVCQCLCVRVSMFVLVLFVFCICRKMELIKKCFC